MPVATEQQGRQIPLWINGEDVVTSKVFEVQHPSTGKVSSKVCGASEDDVYVIILANLMVILLTRHRLFRQETSH